MELAAMSKCPFCMREAGEQAWICRHCGEYLEGRRTLWTEYLQLYRQSPRPLRKLLCQELNPVQGKFFTKLIRRKLDLGKAAKPEWHFLTKRIFLGIQCIVVILALAAIALSTMHIYRAATTSLGYRYPFRSAKFDVPIPGNASLNTANGAREVYQMPGSEQQILGFFDRQLRLEGWRPYGRMLNGHQVYRKDDLWIGVSIEKAGGSFTLSSPSGR